MKGGKQGSSSQPTGIRDDLEEEDVEESYYRYMEENPNAGLAPVEEDNPEVEYDEDGNPIPPDKKKIIDPLPPIDHSQIEYKPFRKDFYEGHEEIEKLTDRQVSELRKALGITVSGRDAPKPVSSFGHLNFEEKLIKAIIKAEYTTPTPIQAQAVPCALMGRDVLGIAQTGKFIVKPGPDRATKSWQHVCIWIYVVNSVTCPHQNQLPDQAHICAKKSFFDLNLKASK